MLTTSAKRLCGADASGSKATEKRGVPRPTAATLVVHMTGLSAQIIALYVVAFAPSRLSTLVRTWKNRRVGASVAE